MVGQRRSVCVQVGRRGAVVGLVALLSVVGVTAEAGAAGSTELVSVSSTERQSRFGVSDVTGEPSGRYVSWTSDSSLFAPGDTNQLLDVFVRDTVAGVTERVSVSGRGAQGDGPSSAPALSDSAQVVAFGSSSTDLVPGDTNGQSDVFVRDRIARTTTRVSTSSTGAQARGDSSAADISSDGRFVLFRSSAANLVPGDSDDAFVRDRVTGTTERVSLGNGDGQRPHGGLPTSISGDGRFVAYSGATAAGLQVYLRDRLRATTTLVSQRPRGGPGSGDSTNARLSDDGRTVAFVSTAPDLVPGDEAYEDVFVRDLTAGTTRRVGKGGAVTDISGNGRYVISRAAGTEELFRFDLHSQAKQRLAVTPSGARPNNYSYLGANAFRHDGSSVVFTSEAADLVATDSNGYYTDAFLRRF